MFDLRVFAGPGGVKSPDIVRPAPGGEVHGGGRGPGQPISALVHPLPHVGVGLAGGLGHTLAVVDADQIVVVILRLLELLPGEVEQYIQVYRTGYISPGEVVHVSRVVGGPVSKPGPKIVPAQQIIPVLLHYSYLY